MILRYYETKKKLLISYIVDYYYYKPFSMKSILNLYATGVSCGFNIIY